MPQTARNGLLVARDLELVGWLDRLVGASVDQIRGRFGLSRSHCYRRLQVLQQHGLVASHHLLARRPVLYAVAGRTIPAVGYEHAHALSELVLTRELAGSHVVTDVELRRERAGQRTLDGRLDDRELEVVVGCRRTPDLVERMGDEGLRAYEIELSSKGRRRRERILAAYAASEYVKVEWIVPGDRLAALLGSEIREMGLSDFMRVRR